MFTSLKAFLAFFSRRAVLVKLKRFRARKPFIIHHYLKNTLPTLQPQKCSEISKELSQSSENLSWKRPSTSAILVRLVREWFDWLMKNSSKHLALASCSIFTRNMLKQDRNKPRLWSPLRQDRYHDERGTLAFTRVFVLTAWYCVAVKTSLNQFVFLLLLV